MAELHSEEHRDLERLFEELGLGRVEDRLTVADHFLATEEHLTAKRMTDILADKGHHLDPSFVRGTLELLCRLGFALKKEFTDQPPLYEHRHLDDHHDHLICTGCSAIVEFVDPEMENLQKAVADEHGFSLLDHRHQLYGLCPRCRARRTPGLPLAVCSPGEKVRILTCGGGRKNTSRLADMGLTPGQEVEILTNSGGPVVVVCGGTRLALGRNMACKLVCEPAEESD